MLPVQSTPTRPTPSTLTIDRLLAALAAGTAGELLADACNLPRPAALTVATPPARVVLPDEVTR